MKKLLISLICFVFSACSAFDDYEPANFYVEGDTAYMNGVIDTGTPELIKEMLANEPQLRTIVMQTVDGSVDDEANLVASRLIRQRGLDTHLPADGLIASGGTDFFLAGNKRSIEPGARVGVHSWAGEDIDNAAKLPGNHPEHQKYLQYYKDMGIPADFYWFTLEAADSDDMHWMTKEEIRRYKITTP